MVAMDMDVSWMCISLKHNPSFVSLPRVLCLSCTIFSVLDLSLVNKIHSRHIIVVEGVRKPRKQGVQRYKGTPAVYPVEETGVFRLSARPFARFEPVDGHTQLLWFPQQATLAVNTSETLPKCDIPFVPLPDDRSKVRNALRTCTKDLCWVGVFLSVQLLIQLTNFLHP